MPAEVKFDENPRWKPLLDKAIERGLRKALLEVKNRVKTTAPVDKGNLKNNNYIEQKGFAGIVYNTMEYAPDVEYGTKPHVILPKNKSYLAFKINGKWVRTKKVNHPGTKPQPFYRPALYNNTSLLLAKVNNEIRKLLK